MSKYYLGSGWTDTEINEKTDNGETNWVDKIKNIFIISRETWIRIIIYASGLLVLIGKCSDFVVVQRKLFFERKKSYILHYMSNL